MTILYVFPTVQRQGFRTLHVRVDMFVTSAKEVMFSLTFVCLLAALGKSNSAGFFSPKFDEKVAHGPRKKSLDFGRNSDHVRGLGLR